MKTYPQGEVMFFFNMKFREVEGVGYNAKVGGDGKRENP